jgi:hypothetical protein
VYIATPGEGTYFAPPGLVLDTAGDRWLEVPQLGSDRVHVQGRAVAGAGWELFVFGGAAFSNRRPGGRLLRATSIWSPPAAQR